MGIDRAPRHPLDQPVWHNFGSCPCGTYHAPPPDTSSRTKSEDDA